MRRWFAIALLVLLPFQFTWAAVASYCGHESDAQAQHFGAGLGEVHIHRAGLLDGGQRSGVSSTHQGPFGHCRLADAAGNGCGDGGVGQVDAGGFRCRLGGADIGLGLALGAVRCVARVFTYVGPRLVFRSEAHARHFATYFLEEIEMYYLG